ncbi:Shikimate kinase [Penicillium psychrosexuale]|uniref:Shikimate kinase n=1 Tax=Penicillium psychrosexuale TaxID=1002107 RepID=UPI002544DDD0|nr:Shikimate kinase [Penicillium psychrosexuale]KAJ5789231.1 Shikimate kinase [Penicillium psychrosexuale]
MSDSEAQATGAPGTKTNPGERNKRDWDEACLENPADEDQSTYLPELGTFSIFCPLAPHKDRGGFDEWFTAAEQCLRPTNLHHLLDAAIQRPSWNSPNAEKWMHLSQQVRAWLASRMDANIVQEIMARGGRVTFADEFMTETRKVMRDEGHTALSAAILKFVRTSLSDFNGTEEFINTLT